jgi:hypothetical protein
VATYITRKDIKHGDKIEVTWLSKGIENTRVGVAREKRGDVWLTKEGGSLGTSGEMKISINLLERLTKEQRLQKRREELFEEFLGEHVSWDYVATPMQKAIERIIEMEEAK